jgi:hypothetical protein
LERSFERQDLLSEVLTLAYGQEAAGLLMLAGLLMTLTGQVKSARRTYLNPWTEDQDAFDEAVHAAITALHAARPGPRPASSYEYAEQFAARAIAAIRRERRRFVDPHLNSALDTIRALLGPIAPRMRIKSDADARRAEIAEAANAILDLINSSPHTPSREALAEVLNKHMKTIPPAQQEAKK